MPPRFSLLFKANLLLSCVLGLLFLSLSGNWTAAGLLLTAAGAVSTVAMCYLIFWLIIAVLRWVKINPFYPGILLFILFDLALVIDFFIFRLYHTHINGMVLNILFSPAAARNVDIGIYPYLAAGVVVLFLAGFQWLLIRGTGNAPRDRQRLLNRRLNRVVVPLLLALILSEKVAFGFANLFARVEITQNMRLIPLYQPLTFNRTAKKWFDFDVQEQIVTPGSAEVGTLDYPTAALRYAKVDRLPNILVIILDAVRWDMITPEVAPNLYRLKQESVVFDSHYSGGNSTRFGVFSLLYGLNAPYWFAFLDAQREAVLFEALRHRDYRISIFASANLNWPEFRKTAFVGIPETITDQYKAEKTWQRDEKMTDDVVQWAGELKEDRPFFGFVFYDAPHQYTYPERDAKFLPDDEGDKNYLTIDASKREVLFNQYRNSIHFDDAQVARVLDRLRENGLLDKTRIIVTADHGEEFFESGEFGHNNSFSEQQIRPILFMRLPGVAPAKVTRMTSHTDLVPTMMHWLGVANPPSDYALGQDLFSPEYRRQMAFSGNWNWSAIVTPDYKLVFSAIPSPVNATQVFETGTYKEADPAIANRFSRQIMETLKDNSAFYR